MTFTTTHPSLLMSGGRDIDLFPMSSELTVEQAAKILDMSEACLDQLLDIGAYEFRQVGNQRLIDRDYLMKQAQWHARTQAGIRDMVRMNQVMGLYDD